MECVIIRVGSAARVFNGAHEKLGFREDGRLAGETFFSVARRGNRARARVLHPPFTYYYTHDTHFTFAFIPELRQSLNTNWMNSS